MCGIVGVIGTRPVTSFLLEGLRRLEYRGYDSAGLAVLGEQGIERRRAEGKIANLEARLVDQPLAGTIGIGHTRWATHGAPTEANAHPHATHKVAVVHNGIIENHQALKRELAAAGYDFASQTDTECVAWLLTSLLDQGLTVEQAVPQALARLEGAFALALLFAEAPDRLIGARRGPPLAVGYGDGEMYLGSDALALAPLTDRIGYLEDGDWVIVTRDDIRFFDAGSRPVERPVRRTALTGAMIGKGEHRHFMAKEIHEQPAVIGDTVNAMIHPATGRLDLPPLPFAPENAPRVTITACGTAFYAGMVAKYWLERHAGMPVELDIASELRYRDAPWPDDGVCVVISQSGETADTLAAMRHAAANGQHTLAVVNAPESTIAREADGVLHTHAGPEIGVASTKAFTTQLACLAGLSIILGRRRGVLDAAREQELVGALKTVPALAATILRHDAAIREIAGEMVEARDVLYLGRGTGYPLALEGALKLKEISYIHAEGYAAGEMKHGPIALIDESVPVIVVAPRDHWFEKTASNIEEVAARGGKVMILSDQSGIERLSDAATWRLALPEVHPFVAPILYAIPVQLLAYHVAVIKGTDVDQPRNLAKSVTVE